MFCGSSDRMLANMSEIDPRADTPLMDWSELDVSGLLPTGTVTLLLADVEGSTRLWETQPDEMTAALGRMNQTVSAIIATHGGVRPVEQGGATASWRPSPAPPTRWPRPWRCNALPCPRSA